MLARLLQFFLGARGSSLEADPCRMFAVHARDTTFDVEDDGRVFDVPASNGVFQVECN